MSAIVGAVLWLWTQLAGLPRRLWAALWPRRETLFRARRVEDLPDTLARGFVYLAGEGDNLWAAAMACPCGCGATIQLNLLPQARPRWIAEEGAGGSVTLTPSVWRQKGCRSHFILRHGRIEWC